MTKSAIMLSRLLTAIILIGAIFASPRQAASQTGTVVKLPVTYYAQTCQETPIAVRVQDVTGLTAYHLEIDFDPGDLLVTAVQNGNFLPAGLEEPDWGYDNTSGTIQYGMARQDYTTPPVDGSGVLMYIWVQGVNPGVNVNFTIRPYVPGSESTNGTGSVLVDWPDAMPIPYTIVNGTVVTQSCPPTDILLSNDLIDENLPVGSAVGTFTTIDPDPEPNFVYELVETATYPDNANFTITGDTLYTNAIFNYEADSSYTIKVSSSVSGGFISEVFTITVTDVNDRPVLGTIGNKSVNEHQLLTFTATASDEDLLPAPDTRTFSLAAGSAGAVPAGALIGSSSGVFTWTPAENQGPGVHIFDVCVSDGFVSDCETIQVTVNEVNAPPSSADKTVTILEDGDYVFLTTDIAFDDSDDIPVNELLGVKIVTLPLDGVLKLGESLVAAGDTISADDLAAGSFKYFPDPNENDTPYSSFPFQVQDDGGTALGGVDLDPVIHYFTINVTSVNDAPAGANKTITLVEDSTGYSFQMTDFGFTDPNDDPDDSFFKVKIITLPGSGSLKFNDIAVTAGQEILASDIGLGKLKFTPAANGFGSPYATFTFQVRDGGGIDNGGVDLDPVANTITINVTAVNDPPVGVGDHYYVNNTMDINLDADPITKEAARLVVAVPGVMSNDSDVDGDTLTVSLKSYTGPGLLTLSSNGSFTYQSQQNVTNYLDSFMYTLSDGHGAEVDVTVNLTIDRIGPPVTLNWLEPVTSPEVYFTAYDDPLTLKFSTTSLNDVAKIQFRWWNTTADPPSWVIVYDQPPVPGKLEYSYTLDMKTLPYRGDVQVYAYVLDDAGSYTRIRFFIVHKARVFLPLIMKN